MPVSLKRKHRGASLGAIVAGLAAAVALVLLGVVIARTTAEPGETADTGAAPSVSSVAQQTPAAATPQQTPATPKPQMQQPVLDDHAGHDHARPPVDRPVVEVGAATAPPVRFEPASLDMGTLKPAELRKSIVEIHNTSDKPLNLLTAKASCNCTGVELSSHEIEPNGKVDMTIFFTASQALGSKQAAVRILFENYDLIQYDLAGEVGLAVRMDPPYLLTSRMVGGQWEPVLKGRVQVSSVDGRPFHILSVNGKAPEIHGYSPGDPPRSSYDLTWDFSEYENCRDAEGKEMPAWWVVETDHPEAPVIDAQVRHPCVTPKRPVPGQEWVLSERRILVGKLPPQGHHDFTIKMNWLRDAQPTEELNAIINNSSAIDLEIIGAQGEGAEREFIVRVTPKPGYHGLFNDRVYMHTGANSRELDLVGTISE